MLFHQSESITYFSIYGKGNRVDDHSAFRSFDAADLFGLSFNAHVLMYKAKTTNTCYGNGEVVLRDGIHGCRNDGYIDPDIAGQLCTNINFSG